jgi:hypothetical protein
LKRWRNIHDNRLNRTRLKLTFYCKELVDAAETNFSGMCCEKWNRLIHSEGVIWSVLEFSMTCVPFNCGLTTKFQVFMPSEEQVYMQQFIHSVRWHWSWRLALRIQATGYLDDAGLQKYGFQLTTGELMNTSGKYILASVCVCVCVCVCVSVCVCARARTIIISGALSVCTVALHLYNCPSLL